MEECMFCSGAVIKPTDVLGSNRNMAMAIEMFGNAFGYKPLKSRNQETCTNGIQLQNGNRLCFDNSGREYAMLDVEIRYCPFCGRELEYES